MLRRRMLIMLAVVLLIVLILGGTKAFSIYKQVQMFSQPRPPVSVAAAQAELRQWQERLPAVGSLKAYQGVELSLEVAGTVKSLHFESGQQVKAGQLLLQLDSDQETALLGTAQADLGLAKVDFGRGSQLVGDSAISRGEFDRLTAQYRRNQAVVEQLKAALAKKSISAPFSGTIGIRQVDVGAYLASGTVIATLQDLSSLYVDFNVPEQALPHLSLGQRVLAQVAAYPDQTFSASLSAINPKVEESTRNLLVRATLANPEGKLLPGMFASLQVLLPDPQPLVVVPENAITYTLYGNSVYRVSEKKGEDGQPQRDANGQPKLIAEQLTVQTGERREGWVVVLKGLQAGDQVVTAGQLKLSPGAAIRISADNALKPAAPGAK
ncbi:efflux RND transporter periplasmic adaptor subunit [Pseudomonas mosselii]|uniref:efflux RND transporter periplasmic adaptor subunit n=1 Tax=Pseudomonas mosselii TaxID=78327 RepID=UPI000A0F80AB|nr:efflux RND transporter periplasmic adaptor subunit [Pseudomonas mosselii]MBC3449683.1 efflux RND transporter periplasmic adaptor subunit [Pseudomonas mosselii]MDH1658700.1 efflux RND transporter periplasmic adaptor subunit [Pseudomonas mosselii]MDH1715153.1 efflux RND transporter periplasmic adaptor subunit [Pseudomonas mosselii]MDH1719781.1 efflux RND transporter periplasmic adaptor subunit [Pseudomonas mosselii]MDN4496278.1 efflux RND transporter periplasmic adaptor subunit [Pseudomonas m